MVIRRFQERKDECGKWKTEIPPNVSSKVLKASKESRILRMINAGDGDYELFEYTRTYVVKLGSFTCDCVAATSVIPPPIKRQPGRPKLQRKRELSEKPRETRSSSVVCQAYKQFGHNKRSCSKSNQSNKKRCALFQRKTQSQGSASSPQPLSQT
ncbi:hypothetical protein EZV62_001279 [Acer yangbiense]|uniref:Uncharacterized protein n=1 Tax=Acer yangbiense TaxID=1000413 RepID=A0A5C7ITL3_9ROSI|nr:hypothetical protein EZV62_001279 [Acer yangbiense]